MTDSRGRVADGGHVELADALPRLPGASGEPFAVVFGHGSLSVEVFAPRGVDTRQPHTRDEVYVVMQGAGEFVSGETRRAFAPGAFLFVPAGVAHRFENFTDESGRPGALLRAGGRGEGVSGLAPVGAPVVCLS